MKIISTDLGQPSALKFLNDLALVSDSYESSLFGHRGFEQLEVTCNPFNDFSGNVLWNVEGNAHDKREYH